MVESIECHFPEMRTANSFIEGATSAWLAADEHIDTKEVAWLAAQNSILIVTPDRRRLAVSLAPY
ncbi:MULTISPECIES: hypothetical protein [unclassified Oceanobacter]|uniref:hypothetical protein n=1 Tax=unclassified Oceanobacter TaxID=2620260 RepID=UPI0027343940|nr:MULTISPECIES: hypothetical protein [unclassified Oceanobacter]MDP2609477.1 hypothetical protein [Oceanobacter sp. 1_MG-2023]MDP2612823.1 hypothetical protein [Oceanobacter sp. 2_MG-2023]